MESVDFNVSHGLISRKNLPIKNAEEGIEKIKEILSKDVIFKYDINNINRIYKEIDLIERKSPSSTCNSFIIIEEVFKKVQTVLNPQNIANVNNLITLHHLQKFSDFTEEVLPVKKYYYELLSNVIKESEFDDLIASDSTLLLDHLIKVRSLVNRNNCDAEIKKISFLDSMQVILEIKNTILNYVIRSIPENCPNILLLVGTTKAGKTTTYFYLLEHEMVQNKIDFSYSSKNDKEGLIGTDQARSSTFIPNIQINSQGHVVIDYAGFEDSNGTLLAVGLELALRALIQKYHPSVLVLESLSNKENAYNAVAKQGQHLERLLGRRGKESCTLCLTKYSQNTSFQAIRQKTKKQQKQNKDKSEKIAEYEQEINKIENEISNQIGIRSENSLKLHTLETKISSEELEILLSRKLTYNILDHYHLDASHEKLLMELFERDLQENKLNLSFKFKNFDEFEVSVKNSSLISSLTEQTNPEIKELLHAPEMDPLFVINLDLKIVESTINSFRSYFVSQIDVNAVQTFLRNAPNETGKLKTLWNNAHSHILQSLGIKLDENTTENDVKLKWEDIQQDIQKKVNKRGGEIRWTTRTSWIWGFFTAGIVVGIKATHEAVVLGNVRQASLEEQIQTCYEKLEALFDIMIKLERLKTHITSKKEQREDNQ